MKRIIILFVLVFSAVGVVSAQNKNLEKLIKKETKLTVKKLQREGYELLSIGALEYEVYNYYSNLHTYGYQQALGFSTSKFINICCNAWKPLPLKLKWYSLIN
jgi:hypothetical protein